MKNSAKLPITFFVMVIMALSFLVLAGNKPVNAVANLDPEVPTSTMTATASPALTFTPTYTATPTFTPTPLTGLTLASTTSGCTSGPYVTCSASVVTTHTDPYRWDFDITYTYGDNRTNMGSKFTYKIKFYTGVYYSGVPIWWNMYPVTNEMMPNRKIDVYYSGVSDLASMDYPSGTWAVPGQPYPYNDFTVIFSRTTTAPEILVRTDKWHLTIATYPNVATPTNTPTPTFTPTATLTPTITKTPTITPTATPQDRWYTGNSHGSVYGVKANISVPATEPFFFTSGESSYVTTATSYWIQTGWRHYKEDTANWPYTLPMEYVEVNPPPPFSYIVQHYNSQNWGEVVEYKITWSSSLNQWCAHIDGDLKMCRDLGFSAPAYVNAHSEVHVSPLNELSTTFLDVSYLDSNSIWNSFNVGLWREDTPYQVNKFYDYEYYNYGP